MQFISKLSFNFHKYCRCSFSDDIFQTNYGLCFLSFFIYYTIDIYRKYSILCNVNVLASMLTLPFISIVCIVKSILMSMLFVFQTPQKSFMNLVVEGYMYMPANLTSACFNLMHVHPT